MYYDQLECDDIRHTLPAPQFVFQTAFAAPDLLFLGCWRRGEICKAPSNIMERTLLAYSVYYRKTHLPLSGVVSQVVGDVS